MTPYNGDLATFFAINSCGASGEKNDTFKSSRVPPLGDKIVLVYK